MSQRRYITLNVPAGGGADVVFAAVQIELLDGSVVGAETCVYPEQIAPGVVVTRQRTKIGATVLTDEDDLVLRWVYENSALGTLDAPYEAGLRDRGRRRRKPTAR